MWPLQEVVFTAGLKMKKSNKNGDVLEDVQICAFHEVS